MLEARGEVAVAERAGRERLWDLAERVFPDTPTVPLEEAARYGLGQLTRVYGSRPVAVSDGAAEVVRQQHAWGNAVSHFTGNVQLVGDRLGTRTTQTPRVRIAADG